ncbi:MAG: ATP-binding cassette domain-containing protein, partial [Megasphaera sp.]|nr:ATP-binding cassette domain-containing protein [Megasphaera sp.]
GLWDLCSALPEGLETPFRQEFFSRGQLQLLSIARAVVMNPRILLLDEITANLDALTEQQVLTALQAASQNRTVLSISHRLYEAQGGRMVIMGTAKHGSPS